MSVRFHLDDGSSLGLTVSHEQARALLVVIGIDDAEAAEGVGLAGGPFRGQFKPAWVLSRIGMFRRAMTAGRIREFTTTHLDRNDLLRCVMALEELSERAERLKVPLSFSEDTL